MTDPQPKAIHEALNDVMKEVQSIAKNDRNDQQRFNFRGIDAVINAVGPALRRARVVVAPMVEDVTHETFHTSKGTQMRNTTVRVRFRFHGPAGDYLDAVCLGEAADAGDKSVPKAQSVAFRTALLQTLAIPTNEPDPDSQVYERAAPAQQREPSGRDWRADIGQLTSVEQVQALWRECAAFGELTDEIRSAMTERAAELDQRPPAAVDDLDTSSSASRQHYIDTGSYLPAAGGALTERPAEVAPRDQHQPA